MSTSDRSGLGRRVQRKRKDGRIAALLIPPLGSIKLYEDRIESPWGSGSLKGAKARTEQRGWRSHKTWVIIEGPEIAIAKKTFGQAAVYQTGVERFVAQVNQAAQRLEASQETAAPDELS